MPGKLVPTAFHHGCAAVRKKNTRSGTPSSAYGSKRDALVSLLISAVVLCLRACVLPFSLIFSGKSSAEFNLPSTSSLPASLCFSVLSKAHPTGLRLQTQYAEERSEWIRQLKQAFMKRTVKATASGASSATHSAAASPRAASTTISGAASSDPMSAPVTTVGSAKKMRRASESSGMGGGGTLGGVAEMQLAQSQQGHGRAASFLPSFSTPAEAPSPSPLARFKSDTQ